MLYMEVVKRVNPKSSHHKEKKNFYFVSIWDDGYSLNCGNYFMMYMWAKLLCCTP